MTNWIFIRHGESTANAANQLSGWQDVRLTTKGQQQAREIGAKLRNINFDLVVSSDLYRAKETARLAMEEWSNLTKRQAPIIHTDTQFRERNFLTLQGRNKSELRASGIMEQLTCWDSAPYGIETYNQLLHRVLPSLKRWSIQKNCLLFAHGGVIRVLTCHFNNHIKAQAGKWKIPNASMIKMRINLK